MQQDVSSWIIDILKTYGLAGLVMAALAFAVYKLYGRNQELNDAINDLGKEAVKTNETVTNALNTMAEVNRQTNASIQLVSAGVQQLLFMPHNLPRHRE